MAAKTCASWRRRVAPLSVVSILIAASTQLAVTAQQPRFSATVDLIAVEAQVVDEDGNPVSSLGPQNFEVSISGRKRRIVAADFIQASMPGGLAPLRPTVRGPQATNVWPTTEASGSGRVYVLAFDIDSFSVQDSRDVVAAARGFIQRLQPGDTVGLHVFPVGPGINPTLDHSRVSRAVDGLVGRSQSAPGELNLSLSEVVDITAEYHRSSPISAGTPAPIAPGAGTVSGFAASLLDSGEGSTLRRIQLRECAAASPACAEMIQAEAATRAYHLEGRARQGLLGLRSLIVRLNEQPGRKTVVLFSAGMPVSDRSGGRPDVGDLAREFGQDAAVANTAIYTVYVDSRRLRANSAEARRGGSTRTSSDRDLTIGGRLLGQFSGASGGALLYVTSDSGELALDRVLRETSAHYLLAVEPAADDRDGRPRDLRVRTTRTGDVTVRSRSWVVVPRAGRSGS